MFIKSNTNSLMSTEHICQANRKTLNYCKSSKNSTCHNDSYTIRVI